MKGRIEGLHHITAIAGDAQRNYDFYTKVLGLRLVKKTVNFDDPGTYHFYYGDEKGTPGTILTFFPWAHIKRGQDGTGMATGIGYAVPPGSLGFWQQRLDHFQVKRGEISTRFGEPYLPFEDPDGLVLELIAPAAEDERVPWTIAGLSADKAIRGFYNVTLTLNDLTATAQVLADIFGYRRLATEGNRTRFITDAADNAAIVDLVEAPDGKEGRLGGGINHHVAFRVSNEETLMQFREKIVAQGFHITPRIDRNYFFSLYFREPGGVLFELATDNPGFGVDEPLSELGTHLKLPAQYEPRRAEIERILPPIR